ncbi:MAG: hypothetical protein IT366_12010 [Candidatus Hydrogenedentes bacterium]|nr:hypothetical protein [Candidatus Hydrogenedentota bacterium]
MTRGKFAICVAAGQLFGSVFAFVLDRQLTGQWHLYYLLALLCSVVIVGAVLYAVFPYTPESLLKLRHTDRIRKYSDEKFEAVADRLTGLK